MNTEARHEEISRMFEVAARRTVTDMVKRGARRYAAEPALLGMIFDTLPTLRPRGMVVALQSVKLPMRRHFGFGGEVPHLNLKSAKLYARYLRAKESQLARKEIA